MDLDFTEEQDMLRRTARSFLEKECDKQVVRELERSNKGYSPSMWKRFAELGWLGLGLPEEHDCSGGSLLDLVVLHQEMGRALCPSPHLSTVIHCGSVIAEAGSKEQRNLLSEIANGELIIAFALPEAAANWQASDINMAATQDGDSYVLSGRKLFVHWAEQSDKLLVAARTGQAADPRQGISLFLVDSRTEGISFNPLKTIAKDKQAVVDFKNVRVPAKDVVGRLNGGWPVAQRAIERGLVALCAQMIGGSEKVLEMSTEYAKVRVQFDRPIGSFQAIQHYLADIATEIAGARTLTYKAAWMLDAGLPATKQVAMAKAQAGDTYRHVVGVGQQVHGGMGYTLESDMELYFRRAKAAQLSMGPSSVWEEIVAQQIGL